MRSNFNLPDFMFISISGTKLFALALQIYIATSIFYIFPSGYPQPADLMLALAIGIALLFFLFNESWKINPPIGFVLLFALCTFFINAVHYFMTPDKRFLLSSFYYIYNAGAFLLVYGLYKKHHMRLQNSLYLAVAFSIVAQFVFVFFLGVTDAGRAIGTFNNPNQLAYWSLLSLCLIIALRYPSPLILKDYILIFILLLIEMESLSKAAIIACMFILMCFSFTHMVKPLPRAILVGVGLAGVVFVLFSFQTVVQLAGEIPSINQTVERLSQIGMDSDDNLEGRGYTRMINNPHYLILGAGEGGYSRFPELPYELHSGLATLLFCYGIVGFTLFGLFLYAVLKKLPIQFWILIAGIMLYGLTHQNLRFTYFWVFLGIIAAIGDMKSFPSKSFKR